MRDRDDGAALGEAVEGLLDEALALVIEGGSGFVEDEHGRIAQDRARDGEALALATGERDAALADGRLVALRHF